MPTTSDALYNKPTRPRVNIYALSDSAYATPLYTYTPFTGSPSNPVTGLSFNTSMTNVGVCELKIENNDDAIDPEPLRTGCRVKVELSKDGTTFYNAFKGLSRGSLHDIMHTNAKELTLRSYNYLIRLDERVWNAVIESEKDASENYVPTASMFTNVLLDDILNLNANYVDSVDDSTLHNIIKRDNIVGSPLNTWVPRVDAQFTTLGAVVDEVLEYSNAVLIMDMDTDQLEVYNPDVISANTKAFLITTAVNKNADNAENTMYPREAYQHGIDYDFSGAGNRLIASYISPLTTLGTEGTAGTVFEPTGLADTAPGSKNTVQVQEVEDEMDLIYLAHFFRPTFSPIKDIRLGCRILNIAPNRHSKIEIRSHNSSNNQPGGIIGTMTAYAGSPNAGGTGVVFSSSNGYPTNTNIVIGTPTGVIGPSVTVGGDYWMVFWNDSTNHTDTWTGTSKGITWLTDEGTGRWSKSGNRGSSWNFSGWSIFGPGSGGTKDDDGYFRMGFRGVSGGTGGTPAVNADQLVIARDTNAMKKGGMIERTMTSLPVHLIDRKTIEHWLYPKLYTAAKPRVSFNYPSLTMPNRPPKAGDIAVHVDPLAKVGTKTTPIQTTVITDVSYDFGQDDHSRIGLRKLGLSTMGIRRGYY
jgi:hypothetical protein